MLPRYYSFFGGLFFLLAFSSCSTAPSVDQLNGRTMGTTYQVSLPIGSVDLDKTQRHIDSMLIALNLSVSTYIDSSLISLINTSTDTTTRHAVDEHFIANFEAAQTIYTATDGAFNPAIGPLVKAWGFGAEEPRQLNENQVDSLRMLVDFDAFILDSSSRTLIKQIPGARLDFSAIAKGYGVDLVGKYLEIQGISDYFVEIGGEVRTRGIHPEGRAWRLGIDRPEEHPESNQRALQAVVPLGDHAVATSGNYRNFYVRDGRKYVHTINPTTGYPEISSLLSVSVIANTCTEADGYATAFMVMGLEKAEQLVSETSGLEAYFISADSAGNFVERFTEGFPDKIEE